MGFREPLDLSEILPDYREHLGSFSGTTGINFVKPTVPDTEDYQEQSLGWGSSQPHLQAGYQPRSSTLDDPWRVGNGPATCSTTQDLALARPTFAWDVNGWYRTIGVPWPYVNAHRGSLARWYAANGVETPRAMYYLKRLLDRSVRPRYDDMALGEPFLDDEYVQEAMKMRAQAEASRRSAEGSYTDASMVLDEWGYKLDQIDEDGVDTTSNDVQDVVSPESQADKFEPIEWTYSYWLWRSHRTDTNRLEQWQGLLVSALSAQRCRVDLAVGYVGKQPHPYVIGRADGHVIVYLNEAQEPTEEIAASAAAALMQDLSKTR